MKGFSFFSTVFMEIMHFLMGIALVVSAGYITNPMVPCFKPLGGCMVDSAFHHSEVDKVSTRNSWEFSNLYPEQGVLFFYIRLKSDSNVFLFGYGTRFCGLVLMNATY